MTFRFAFARSTAFALVAMMVAVSLLSRAWIPAGWMPSGEKAFAVTICTGIETQQMWMTPDGTIHKSDPTKKEHKQDEGSGKGCAFAAAGMPVLASIADAAPLAPLAAPSRIFAAPDAVTVGQGLAAPPPPSTGPPVLI